MTDMDGLLICHETFTTDDHLYDAASREIPVLLVMKSNWYLIFIRNLQNSPYSCA